LIPETTEATGKNMSIREFDEAHFSKPVFVPQKRDPRALARQIADNHGVTVDDLVGKSRFHHLAVARHELYATLRQWGWSYPAIGRFVGRDHTTIISAIKVPPKDTPSPGDGYLAAPFPPKSKGGRPQRASSIDYIRDESGNLIRVRH
jgi:hypothetical protein